MTPTQVLRPNRRDCHQRRGISHHQPLQYSIDRPAPTRLPEAVIWIADPKVPEISNPWDVEPSGEVARDDQPSKRRRTAKDDIRLPFFDQSFAGGNNRLDPVPSHVRNVNQSVVMALNPVQSRVAQPPASPRRCHGSPSDRALRAAAEIPPQEIEPVLARPIFRIDVFSRNLAWQASIFGNVCRQNS